MQLQLRPMPTSAYLLTQQVVRSWKAHRLRTTLSSPTSVRPRAEHALTAWGEEQAMLGVGQAGQEGVVSVGTWGT